MRVTAAVRAYGRALVGLRRWLNRPMSFDEARRRVAQRLETRGESFLRLLRRCVFANPKSPYLPLLRRADCTEDDIARGVRRDGVEAELRRLKDAGVWLSLDEFKGRAPIVRGDLELHPQASDFGNPRLSPVVAGGSGGSSGRPVQSIFDFDTLEVIATYQAFFLELCGLRGAPFAVWNARMPAPSGVVNTLSYAKLGQPPERWFDVESGPAHWSGWVGRILTAALMGTSHLSRFPLSQPEPGPVDAVLRWVLRSRDRAGRCAIHCCASTGTRLSQAAQVRGESLEGLTLHLGGEPITPARWNEILAAGARPWPRYASTEMGTMAIACTNSREIADHHLCRDLIGLVQDDGTDEATPSILYLTSLHKATPKVLINVQLGDCARVVRRRCGCLFDQMGLHPHLLQVHSVARVTCEAMTVSAWELVAIVEEVLRPRYGGSPVDYQWAEQEDARGQGRLRLRVSPSVGPLEPERVVRDVLRELARRSRAGSTIASVWRDAGTVSVARERPRITAAGKTLPFMREAPA